MSHAFTQVALNVLGPARGANNPADLLERIGSREWDVGLLWLDCIGLSLYFWRKVQQMGLQDAMPPAVCARFQERQVQNSIRTEVMLREWRSLQNLFDSSGIRCVVLKGLAKVPDYCPDPALRVQFDHDWLIDRNSFDRVDVLLKSSGYQKKSMREGDRSVYVQNGSSRSDSWDPKDSYAARIPRPVEIHLDLWDSENEKVFFDLPGDLMARRVSRSWGSDVYSSLSVEDALVFEALHAFRHIIHNWCRLSVLYEIAHFLDQHSSDRFKWSRFCARIENNLPLRRATGVIFALAARVFRVPRAFGDVPAGFFALTPELRLWVERYGRKSALGNFSKDKFSLFLLRGFVEEGIGWRDVRRRRLFPLHRPHRFHAMAKNGILVGLTAKCREGIRFVSRLGFHMRGTLLYACECPRWSFLIRREMRKRSSSSLTEVSRAEAHRANFSAARSRL